MSDVGKTRAQLLEELEASRQRVRQLEAQLHHSQQLERLGLMAGGMANDFNNILTGLLGNVDMALRDVPSHSTIHSLLHDIRQAGRRAAALTGQMLAYSGKGKLIVEDVDLSALVRELSGLLASSTAHKARLRFDLAAQLPAVRADATQLRQIILSLVSNASDALRDEGGLVLIGTYTTDIDTAGHRAAGSALAPGRYVTLEVTDTGCGMDGETKAKIFDPFFTTKRTGRGLGLAAVQGIVRGHEGAILVDSELSQGTTFQVLLPALDHPAAPLAEQTRRCYDWRRAGTVLVVDDEDLVRRFAARLLWRLGHAVLLAADGAEAVQLFRERHDEIACVLLDLNMPCMNGVETFIELSRIDGDVPVILTSGYGELDATDRFENLGLAGFLQKPYELESMQAKLLEVLGEPRHA